MTKQVNPFSWTSKIPFKLKCMDVGWNNSCQRTWILVVVGCCCVAPSGPPRNVIGSARSNSSIVLQWDSPDPAQWNGQLLGYVVRYKLSGYPDSTQTFENITNFQYSVIHELVGLIYFKEYQISVAAYNSRGLGVFSDEIWVWTSEGRPTAPPRNVIASAISSTAIAVRWLPPSPQRINGITQGYHINLTAVFNDSVVNLRRTFMSNLTNMLGEQTAILTGLQKYVEYQLVVMCFTAAGSGPPSPSVHVHTLEDGKMMTSLVVNVAYDSMSGMDSGCTVLSNLPCAVSLTLLMCKIWHSNPSWGGKAFTESTISPPIRWPASAIFVHPLFTLILFDLQLENSVQGGGIFTVSILTRPKGELYLNYIRVVLDQGS